jgi:hypothetical protein
VLASHHIQRDEKRRRRRKERRRMNAIDIGCSDLDETLEKSTRKSKSSSKNIHTFIHSFCHVLLYVCSKVNESKSSRAVGLVEREEKKREKDELLSFFLLALFSAFCGKLDL